MASYYLASVNSDILTKAGCTVKGAKRLASERCHFHGQPTRVLLRVDLARGSADGVWIFGLGYREVARYVPRAKVG